MEFITCKKLVLLSLIAISVLATAQTQETTLSGDYLIKETPGLTPEVFAPGFISTDKMERSLFFHPDGKEIYFTREGDQGLTNIMVTRLDGVTWSEPEALPIPNKESFRAFVSKDGKRLFFASIDLIDEQDSRMEYNIWVSDRSGGSWKDPQPLGPEINTTNALEMHPSVSDDGTLYFKRFNFMDETEKIFYSEWKDTKYQQAQPFEADLGSFAEDPFISPDESYLIFNPSGPEKFGAMHISFKDEKGNWSKPQDMGLGGELPSLSPDGKYLFFIKNNDVYWVDAKIVETFRKDN